MNSEDPKTSAKSDLNMKIARLQEQLFASQQKISFLQMALRGLLEYLVEKEEIAWSSHLTTFLQLLPASDYHCYNCKEENVPHSEHITNLQQLSTLEEGEYRYLVAYLELENGNCTSETCDEDGVPVICSKCWNNARKAYMSNK